MGSIKKFARTVDRYQQKHKHAAIIYAVIKKYGEDSAGNQAALTTYYGFLALFPLLMVATTLTNTLLIGHPQLQTTVLNSITSYFPLLGSGLAHHVHALRKSGVALFVGLLFTLYGARGVTNAFMSSVQHIWHVPEDIRQGFPKSYLKSLLLLIIGGLGFIVAAMLAGLAASAGHSIWSRILSLAINILILYLLFALLINLSLPKRIPLRDVRVGARFAAIGIVILQLLGGYLLVSELKNLSALYSYFAIPLGLLFWIYLQTQVLFYAIELSSVTAKKLWPRSLDAQSPTSIDKKIMREQQVEF